MLKINDNVDLKELEKYGFYKPQKGKYKSYVLLTNNGPRDGSHLSICKYDNKQKMIMLIQYAYDYRLSLDVLYDLIKADLVEKVVSDE